MQPFSHSLPRSPHSRLLLAAFIVIAALTGCGSSPWSSTYVGTRDPEAARAAESGQARSVVVRSVPWERVNQTLDELQREVAASDVHPDEWSPEKKAEAKAKLLRGLQVAESPERVEILGKSEFRTTDAIHPETEKGEAELVAFARSIGAQRVIWSGRYLGKVDRTVKEPVTTYSTGADWNVDHHGRNRPTSFSESTTTWVPIRVQMDELGYIAYFLRPAR